MDILADLTPAQCDAVTHLDRPLLIMAGPGSGKTRVITRRVVHLLQQGIKPWNILAITFTNKAAEEMRGRVNTLVPNSRVWISTFHSFGVRLLRQYAHRLGLERDFTIYDQDDRKRLIRDVLDEANVDPHHFSPEKIQAAISRAKNQLHGPSEYARTANDFFGQTVLKLYPLYERRLREANALDFDDLLLWVARMLLSPDTADIRAELDARFRYVLVDEYQDTNHAQYVIVRQLSIDHPNICVVGDPDQSIYRFRGSDIRNILDFKRDFPQARVIALDWNFRSTQVIVKAVEHLINRNTKRQDELKRLRTNNPEGKPVHVLRFAMSTDEAIGIAERVRQGVDQQGRQYRDFAILMRINALSRGLEAAMMQYRIPYQIVRGLAFFERKENKDIIAYVRLLVNPRDDLSFLRVINEPARGVGRVSLEHLRQYAQPRGLSLLAAAGEVERITAIKGKAARGLAEFARLMRELREVAEAPAEDVIRHVLDRSGYRTMLLHSTDPQDLERLANIEELITAAQQFEQPDAERTGITAFLEQVALVSDVDGYKEDQDRVAIMTLHAAKGLEFPVVYIVAVEQGLLPHERSANNPEELEEERRLTYVGMTRAKEELYLTHAKTREFRGTLLYAIPSSFLEELPTEGVVRLDFARDDQFPPANRYNDEDILSQARQRRKTSVEDRWKTMGPRTATKAEPVPGVDYNGLSAGDLVRHKIYGVGKVLELSGYGTMRRAKIRFGKVGDKTFVLEKASLELVNNKS